MYINASFSRSGLILGKLGYTCGTRTQRCRGVIITTKCSYRGYKKARDFSAMGSSAFKNENEMEKEVQQPIMVLGAGVLGLTTAITIQERYPALKGRVTIVAAELPSLPVSWRVNGTVDAEGNLESRDLDQSVSVPSVDYASMWAGAHYRPLPRSTRQLEDEFELAVRTSEVMNRIAEEYGEDVCGVAVMPAVELLERIPEGTERVVSALKNGDVYAGVGDGFRVLTNDELKKYDGEGRLTWGCEYTSYCVNVHLFCCWLLDRFIEAGGKVLQRKLNGLEEVFDLAEDIGLWGKDEGSEKAPHILVNTSGRNFDTDPKMEFIRGQTVLVRNEYRTTITRQMTDGSWSFLIPRPGGGGTVVGGTKEIGDVEIEARPETREILLANAAKCFPDFVNHVDEFEVMMDNVGRRPWREGGLRIEAEDISHSGTSRRMVLHGYGAGGRGYELSWGVAERILDLIEGQIKQSKPSS